MSDAVYDLVFSGQLARGAELAEAKRNIAQLFKIADAKVEQLFSGKEVVLKKGISFDVATKYRVAIKRAGCLVELREQQVVKPAAKAVFNVPAAEPESASKAHVAQASAASTSAPMSEASPASSFSSSVSTVPEVESFDLAPAGEALLKESEKRSVEPVLVDTSSLSVKAGGDLLEADEKTVFVEREVSLQASLAPVGEQLLQESEREHIEPLEVDVSTLDLAEVGVDLGQETEKKEEKVPDISHLHLE
ncbi:hypothetical protein [Agaribacterium sp. ZY112]|uniref:hypothetical protein n=1 Tax=Agaribacterium sp. ZY112 TaxID=3233574 RepID=UPI003523BC60